MQIVCPIVGVNFRPSEAREAVKAMTMESAEALWLDREPENQYDANAVRVMLNNEHIGYIPKSHNGPLAESLDADPEGYSISIVAFENSLRPVLEITFGEDA